MDGQRLSPVGLHETNIQAPSGYKNGTFQRPLSIVFGAGDVYPWKIGL